MEDKADSSFLPATWTANPFKIITQISLIVFMALVIGVGLPAVVALATHTFHDEQVEAILARKFPEKYQELSEFRRRANARQTELSRIDSILTNCSVHPEVWPQLGSLIQTREVLKAESKQERPPIIVSGFSQGNLLGLWPVAYSCLGILVFVMGPKSGGLKRRIGAGLLLFLFIVFMHRWPVWWRNSSLGQIGRTTYAGNNLDMHPVPFFVQEFMGILVDILIALVWVKWLSYLVQLRSDLFAKAPSEKLTVDAAFDKRRRARVSHEFYRWQIASAVLAGAFINYTYFFWKTVFIENDARYLVSAVTMHALWAFTWIIVSLPLICTWQQWSRIKARAITLLLSADSDVKDKELKLKVLLESDPVSTRKISASSVAGAVAFVLPLLQVFWK